MLMVYNRIKLLRTERNYSRQDLADAVGVNFQTIGYLERGDYNASLELALKLARFFDLPLEEVFSLNIFVPLSQQLRQQKNQKKEG